MKDLQRRRFEDDMKWDQILQRPVSKGWLKEHDWTASWGRVERPSPPAHPQVSTDGTIVKIHLESLAYETLPD